MKTQSPQKQLSAFELMQIALVEARKGTRKTRPNPKVGAALQAETGEIVSSHHEYAGGPHAEARVIEEAKRLNISTVGARMAVTLEPCSHFGKTPPCAEALIQAGIREVYVALEDPNPLVRGKGLQLLKNAGIKTELGLMSDEAREINRTWLKAHENGRPHVTLKMATSMDGMWVSEKGESQWITSSEARTHSHSLRARVDALVTSKKTVLQDKPQFTARANTGELLANQPKILVLSRDSKLDVATTSLANHPGGSESFLVQDLKAFLKDLYARQILDVMIEAGPTLSAAFMHEGVVDEIWLYQAAKFLGGNGQHLTPAFANGKLPGLEFQIQSIEQISNSDVCLKLQRKSKFA